MIHTHSPIFTALTYCILIAICSRVFFHGSDSRGFRPAILIPEHIAVSYCRQQVAAVI